MNIRVKRNAHLHQSNMESTKSNHTVVVSTLGETELE